MEIIILGLKHKLDGTYRVFDTDFGKSHTPISVGETINIACVDPFPFAYFSSLDKCVNVLDTYDHCYLKVEADLTDEEFNGMIDSGIVYHRFSNRNVTFIEEYKDIFSYALMSYLDFNGINNIKSKQNPLDYYSVCTWLIQQETFSEKERLAMINLIELAFIDYSKTKYSINVHVTNRSKIYLKELDKFSKQYHVPLELDNNFYDKEDIFNMELTPEEFNIILTYGGSRWYAMNKVVTEETLNSLEDKNHFSFFFGLSNDYLEFLSEKIDLNKHLNQFINYNYTINNFDIYDGYNTDYYESVEALLNDKNYRPHIVQEYADFDTGEMEDVQVDLRVDTFFQLIVNEEIIPYLTEIELPILKEFKSEWFKENHYYKNIKRLLD